MLNSHHVSIDQQPKSERGKEKSESENSHHLYFQMAASTPGGSEVVEEVDKDKDKDVREMLSEELGDAIGFLEVRSMMIMLIFYW